MNSFAREGGLVRLSEEGKVVGGRTAGSLATGFLIDAVSLTDVIAIKLAILSKCLRVSSSLLRRGPNMLRIVSIDRRRSNELVRKTCSSTGCWCSGKSSFRKSSDDKRSLLGVTGSFLDFCEENVAVDDGPKNLISQISKS